MNIREYGKIYEGISLGRYKVSNLYKHSLTIDQHQTMIDITETIREDIKNS